MISKVRVIGSDRISLCSDTAVMDDTVQLLQASTFNTTGGDQCCNVCTIL